MATIVVDKAVLDRLKDIQYQRRTQNNEQVFLKDLTAEIVEFYYDQKVNRPINREPVK